MACLVPSVTECSTLVVPSGVRVICRLVDQCANSGNMGHVDPTRLGLTDMTPGSRLSVTLRLPQSACRIHPLLVEALCLAGAKILGPFIHEGLALGKFSAFPRTSYSIGQLQGEA